MYSKTTMKVNFLVKAIMIALFVVGLFVFLADVTKTTASPPSIISYQGKLLVSGNSASTTLPMSFEIYTALTGGSVVYTASGTLAVTTTVNITPVNGLFSINLGDTGTNVIDTNIFKDYGDLYLQVFVNGEALSPRKRITAAPYAFNSKYLDGYFATSTPTTTAQYIPVSDSSGNFNLNDVTSTNIYITGNAAANSISSTAITLNGTTRTDWPTSTVYTAGAGLDLTSDTFSVSTSQDFIWTGQHSFSSTTFNSTTTFPFGIWGANGNVGIGTSTNISLSGYTSRLNVQQASGDLLGISLYAASGTLTTAVAAQNGLGILGLYNNGTSVNGLSTYLIASGKSFMASSSLSIGNNDDGVSFTDKLRVFGDVNLLTNGLLRFNSASGTIGQVLMVSSTGYQEWLSTSTLGIIPPGTEGQTLYSDGSSWLATSNLFVSSSGYVGIGTTTPLARLSLDNDGAILAQGTIGSGWDGGSLGAGTRLMWVPSKGAFRSGYVWSTQWDSASIGTYSFVGGGFGNTASGAESFVGGGQGNNTQAQDSFIGGGDGNTISSAGTRSFIGGGTGNSITGRDSMAFGKYMSVSGINSFGINLYGDSLSQLLEQNNTMAIMGGNVGVGTTTPGTLLSVNGTSTLQNVIPDMNGGLENLSLFNLGASTTRWNSVWANTYNVGSSTWSITQTGTRFGIFDQAEGVGNERVSITSDGNVGIGTTSPDYKLNIFGESEENLFKISTSGNSGILAVTSNGNVGIGTTSPVSKLHLSGGTLTVSNSGTTTIVGEIASTTAFYEVSDLDVSGNYAYTVSQRSGWHAGYFTVIDVTNPTRPSAVGQLYSATYFDDTSAIRVSGKYAYVVTYASFTQDQLSIIDISNPSSPSLVGAGVVDLDGASDVEVSGKYVYILELSLKTLKIYDVSIPAVPFLAGSFATTTWMDRMAIAGKYAYVTGGLDNSFKVLNISNPASVSLVAQITSSTALDGAEDIYVSGRYAYVASADNYSLCIIDISNPANPTIVSSFRDTSLLNSLKSVSVLGNYAYIGAGGAMRILDISDPTNPFMVGGLATSSINGRIVVAGKYAYTAQESTTNNYFDVIDISGIQTPAANIGSLLLGNGTVSNDLQIGNNLIVNNSLTIGVGGIISRGGISVASSSYFGGNVSIGTTSSTSKLTLDNDGGILAKGTYGSGSSDIPSGAGTRMLWYPRKAAFRAGYINSAQWDEAYIGNYSVAFGNGNTASGTYSAVGGGYSNRATKDYSFVGGGDRNTASGLNSFVGSGQLNTSSGNYSFVGGGMLNTSTGNYSFVGGGDHNLASDSNAFVGGGYYNTASDGQAFVGAGYSNVAGGSRSFVGAGQTNTSSGSMSFVGAGDHNVASGNYSFIGGGGYNIASASYSTVNGGYYNTASGANSFVGGGQYGVASGNRSISLGSYMTVSGDYSLGINVSTTAVTLAQANAIALMGGNVGIGTTSPNYKLNVFGATGQNLFKISTSTNQGIFTVNSNGNVGVNTTSPSHLLTVAGDVNIIGAYHINGVVVTSSQWGTNGADIFYDSGDVSIGGGSFLVSGTTGDTPVSGAGTRMMWVPSKGTFTAGSVDGTQWDASNLGTNSAIFGSNNSAKSSHSLISGTGNTIDVGGDFSFIGGGSFNYVLGAASFIGSGSYGVATGTNSFIGGGWGNIVSGDFSFIGGGRFNTSSGEHAFVGSGLYNVSAGNYSVVVGGNSNTSSGSYSFIGAGLNNEVPSSSSFIGAGESNMVTGTHSAIVSGYDNEIGGSYSFIGAGEGNKVFGHHASAFGQNMNVFNNYSFGIALSPAGFTIDNANVMAIMGGSVGIGVVAPSVQLHTTEGVRFAGVADTDGYTCISADGTLSRGATCSTSDRRLKTNISSISDSTDVLGILNKLRGVYYNWDITQPGYEKATTSRQLGMIAQEVQEVLPELVEANAQGNLTINYAQYVGYLTEVVKVQQAEIDALKNVSTTLTVENESNQIIYTVDMGMDIAGRPLLNVSSVVGVDNKWEIDINGTLISKITTSQGAEKKLYGMSSENVEITLSGTSTLKNGEARIIFSDEVKELIDETQPIKVVFSLTSPSSKNIYVSEKSKEGFVLKEVDGNDSGITFDWMVLVKRKIASTIFEEVQPITEQSSGGEVIIDAPTSTEEIATTTPPNPPLEEGEGVTTTPEIPPESVLETPVAEVPPIIEPVATEPEPTVEPAVEPPAVEPSTETPAVE